MASEEIKKYLNMASQKAQLKVLPIIEYIESNYPEAVFDKEYSQKTRIPTYRLGKGSVGIGCRKHYISLYFSGEKSVKITGGLTQKVRCNKNSVNISYCGETDYEALFRGIDKELKG